jgi:hypothetical protein
MAALVMVAAGLVGCTSSSNRTNEAGRPSRTTTTRHGGTTTSTTVDRKVGLVTRPGPSASTVSVVSPAHLSIEVPRTWFIAGSKYGLGCDAPRAPSLVIQDKPGPVVIGPGECVLGTNPKHPALAVVFGSRGVPATPLPDAAGTPEMIGGLRAMVHGPVHDKYRPDTKTELVVLPDRDAWLRIQGYAMSTAMFERKVHALLNTLRSTGPALPPRVPVPTPETFVGSYGAHDAFLRISSPTSAFAWYGGGTPWDTECFKLEPIDGGTRLLATVVSATWFDKDQKEHIGNDPNERPSIGTQQVIELADKDLIATYDPHRKDMGTGHVYMYAQDDWHPKSIASCAPSSSNRADPPGAQH